MGWASGCEFQGTEELTLEGALAQLGRLRRLDRLADGLGALARAAALDEIDPDELAEFLDRDAAEELQSAPGAGRKLEEAGYAERNGNRSTDAARRASGGPGGARRAVRQHEA